MAKIHVLFLAANPEDTMRLALDEEMRAIVQKVRAAEYRDALVFQSGLAVRPDDLLQLLNQHQPHMVHFSGHGDSKGLSLVGNHGRASLVPTRALQALFTTLKDNIRLIFLNACYSSEQARALVQVIDCVIGMKQGIHDRASITFASSFYRAIGFGRSLQEAFDQGIAALLLEGIPEEDIPELLAKDGVDPAQIRLIEPELHSSPADQQPARSENKPLARPDASNIHMELYSAEMEELHQALLDGYPSTHALKLLISYELHENVEIVASGGTLDEKIHSLLMWAISQGKVPLLVNGALNRNPGNLKLRTFAANHGIW